MFRQAIVILLFFSCIPLPVSAQASPEASVLTAKNNLPSNRIYRITPDEKGNLYMATNNGLCLYDGYRFITNPFVKGAVKDLIYRSGYFYFYAAETGLCRIRSILDTVQVVSPVNFYDSIPDNDHYENLFADNEGRIWCSGINNIKYFRSGKKQIFRLPRHHGNRVQHQFLYFCEPVKGDVWLISTDGIAVWKEQTQTFRRYKDPRVNRLRYTAAFFNGKQTIYLATRDHELMAYNILTAAIHKLPPLPEDIIAGQIRQSSVNGHNYLIIASRTKIYAYDLRRKTYRQWYDAQGARIRDLRPADSLSLLWLATGKGLVKLSASPSGLSYVYLPQSGNRFVNSIIADSSRNIWMSDGSNTIWRRTSSGAIQIFRLPDKNAICHTLSTDGERILAATAAGVYQFENGKFSKIRLRGGGLNMNTQKALYDDQDKLWVLTPEAIRVFDASDMTEITGLIQNKADFWKVNKINDMAQNPKDGRIWFAAWMPASFGIAWFDPSGRKIRSVAPFNDKSLFMGDYYNKIFITADGNLLFSGYGGWNKLSAEGKITQVLNPLQYDVGSTEVQGISADSTGHVWFGTSEGLYFYDKNADKAFRFSHADGFPDNDFTHGFCQLPGNELALGIRNGILLANQAKILQPEFRNKLSLTAIRVNGRLREAPKGIIRLENNATDLYLYFSALTFSEDEKIRYRYRFEDDTTWNNIGNSPELHFSRLEHGSYNIIIQAGDNLSHWQGKTLKVALEVPPPFYKTFWFISLLGALTGLIVFGVTRYLFRQHQMKEQMRQQLRDARLAVLRNQMNPHFLFNTLNSINSYIIRHKTEDASNYLTMFSKLVRNILANSQQAKISLSKELETLKLYLELEGMRLNHVFDYSIRLEKMPDPEQVLIPPLILQPFVENAIWHGLRNKEKDGNIEIHIQNTAEQQLQIVIRDNGIGREAAERRQKSRRSHKSFGIAITRNHLHILNEKNEIRITDLYDDAGEATGTEVTITLNLSSHD